MDKKDNEFVDGEPNEVIEDLKGLQGWRDDLLTFKI